MNWYTGDIGTAINESKNKKLIFLVHTFDESQPADELWTKEEIYQLCTEYCVSLKLEASSQSFTQFKQIYPVTTQPTTYLIGTNGLPLEVVSGSVSQDQFLIRMSQAIEKHTDSVSGNAAGTSSSSQDSEQNSATASGSSEDTMKLEDKVALARAKIKAIQEKKKVAQDERERNSELERRKMGQELLKMKRDREEEELRRIAEEKRREKQQDELAKKKVLEQIRLDREEKQKKYSQEKVELERAEAERKAKLELQRQQEKQAEAARNSNVARLQFRFVDGSSVVNQFTPDQTLDEVRQFVAQKLKEMNETSPFAMHTSYPKREFTAADMSSTLRDLQLAPSASLLIIPMRSAGSKAAKKLSQLLPSSSSSSSSSSTPTTSSSAGSSSSSTSTSTSSGGSSSSIVSYASDFVSILLLPFTIIWGIVTSLFVNNNNTTPSGGAGSNSSTGARSSASSSSSSSRSPTSGASNAQDISSLRRRNLDNQRASNIRQLNSQNGDDDENATWNGNSTQQM